MFIRIGNELINTAYVMSLKLIGTDTLRITFSDGKIANAKGRYSDIVKFIDAVEKETDGEALALSRIADALTDDDGICLNITQQPSKL